MMASEDENNTEDLDARIRDLEEQLQSVTQKAEDAEQKAKDAERVAAEERERAEDAMSSKKMDRERIRLARVQRKAAERKAKASESKAKAVQQKLSNVQKERVERGKFEKLAQEEFDARTELRKFVASSLADIMLGVDEAALSAVSRHLQSGLLEEPMISPSRVGQVVGGSETLVHFDLAVVASEQKVVVEGKVQSIGVGISVRGKLWEQIGLTGTADFKRRRESSEEERRGVTHDQRISFSVPLIFASQDELVG